MSDLPEGALTYLFTDLENSTRLWQEHPGLMRPALERHDAILRNHIERHQGHTFKSTGDGVAAVFARATDAVAAALEIQRAFANESWPSPLAFRVRMAMHTGEAQLRDGDYYGSALNRVARLLSTGHGEQILLTHATKELIKDSLPYRASLRELGRHRLRDLDEPEVVFQLAHPELCGEFPPLRSLELHPNNLPVQMTSFVGREAEIAATRAMLGRAHLLTLAGSGGTGKTRLSLQIAASVLEDFPDGVWFVELAPLTDAALLPQAVAAALKLKEEPGTPLESTLAKALHPKRLLLILDNCEHLLSGCALLVNALLRAAPEIKILCSSREALGIDGEAVYRVPSLSLPDPKTRPDAAALERFESVQLFLERARAADPSFVFDDSRSQVVAQICARLDGIPLALELAAARARALSMEQIATRLDDRFRLLTGGSRAALPRQQTLRALIDWSYDMLGPQERAVLQRLSVFAGGWSLESAERVCSGEPVEYYEVLDLLQGLTDKSLVLFDSSTGEGRYRLLETVRQYARDRLIDSGEAGAVRSRHLDTFLTLAESSQTKLEGPEREPWLERLDQDHENIRVALEFSAAADDGGKRLLRFCSALWRFWRDRGHLNEGLAWIDEAFSVTQRESEIDPELAAGVYHSAGALAYSQGDLDAAERYFEAALARRRQLGDPLAQARLLSNLGLVSRFQRKFEIARTCYEESFALLRSCGGQDTLNHHVLNNLALVEMDSGRLEVAERLFSECAAAFRRLGNPDMIARSLHNLGDVARRHGNYVQAREHLRDALRLRRTHRLRSDAATSLHLLALLDRLEEHLETALQLQLESLQLYHEVADRPGILNALLGVAAIAALQGQELRAVQLWSAATRLRDDGCRHPDLQQPESADAGVLALRERLDPNAFKRAWEEGQSLEADNAVAFALETSVGT